MRYICIIILASIIHLTMYAGEEYKFRTVSPEGGYYYDGVKSILQDGHGYIWILTDNTIHRFDGYNYKQYYSFFNKLDSKKKWFFEDLSMGIDGDLIITTSNGVYKYDIFSDSFKIVIDEHVKRIIIDSKNNTWLIDKTDKLALIDKEDESLNYPLYVDKPLRSIKNVCCDKSGFFPYSHYINIYRFNYDLSSFELFYQFPRDHRIVEVKKYEETLWILIKNKGIYALNITTREIEHVYDVRTLTKKSDANISTFLIDKNGLIWCGSKQGLYLYNTETQESKTYTHLATDPFSLPNNSIWTISEDNQKNIWIGTYCSGVSYINLDERNAFRSYTNKNNQLSHSVVCGFAEDDTSVWIATNGGGLNRLDKKSGLFSYYKSDTLSNALSSDFVKSLALDNIHDNLWMATYLGGLNCLNTKTNKVTQFRYTPKEPNSLLNDDLRKVIFDQKRSGIWIIYQLAKLVISFYSFENQSFTHYPIDTPVDNSNYIFDAYLESDSLWILSPQGLSLMNLKDNSVKEIPLHNDFYLNAQSLEMDNMANLWIGTTGSGLIKYNTKTTEVTILSGILKSGVWDIYSLKIDDDGFLWLGTNNGLYKYDKTNNNYHRFGKTDGAQGLVYYLASCFKSKTGELYFGGTNGFTAIAPTSIVTNTHQSKIIISDLLINNTPVPIPIENYNKRDSTADYDLAFKLNYDKTDFGFRFSSDSYLLPSKNKFRFRLKEYNDNWTEVDASNRTALYSKVPAGTYYFEIMGANNDGVWGEPFVIKIVRKPAPWFSWPAYIVYLLLLACIIYLIIRYYDEKKKLKLELHYKNIEREKKEEVYQAQLRFFTNISHDFRTPLSLIIAVINRLRQDGLKEYHYNLLNNNAQHLLHLVNELMDFRTIENGKMPLNIDLIPINSIIKEISSNFVDYADQRNLKFDINCDPLLEGKFCADKQIVEKIVMNLLDNAFKYTKDGGSISIETQTCLTKFRPRYKTKYTISNGFISDKYFSIIVRDTGVGISKESIAEVFERYYKVNTVNAHNHLGTGIGLALVKSLVLLHKGSITIYSERNEGTDIVINFSINKSTYKDDDFIDNEDNAGISNNMDSDINEADMLNEIKEIIHIEKLRILLVEDHIDLRALIAESLSDIYTVIDVSDGSEASKVLENTHIDLIVSDIMMPHKDGITLCAEVKNDLDTSHIPFILLTAKSGVESKIEGANSRADLYFEKPIDLDLLKLSIQNIFQQQQQLKEYYARNYFADSADLSSNERDRKFLEQFINILDEHLDQSEMDVNFIASELSMSRSKLYTKIKSITGKSIVEFILNYRLRKAARFIIEKDLTMRQIMMLVGIESQSYFTNSFKKEYGYTPTAFAAKHKKTESK